MEEYKLTNGNYKNGNSKTEKYNIWNEKFSGMKQKIGKMINGLEYMTIESIQSEVQRGKRLKKKKKGTEPHWLLG